MQGKTWRRGGSEKEGKKGLGGKRCSQLSLVLSTRSNRGEDAAQKNADSPRSQVVLGNALVLAAPLPSHADTYGSAKDGQYNCLSNRVSKYNLGTRNQYLSPFPHPLFPPA